MNHSTVHAGRIEKKYSFLLRSILLFFFLPNYCFCGGSKHRTAANLLSSPASQTPDNRQTSLTCFHRMNSSYGQKEKKSNAQRQKRKIFSDKNNLRTCNFWDDN
jgi:hypothetical protein